MQPRKYQYMQLLGLTEEQQAKLRSLGVDSPAGLWAMIEAAQEKFQTFFGREETIALKRALEQQIPEDQKKALTSLPEFTPSFGAMLEGEPAPLRQRGETDFAERDKLFQDIQLLRPHAGESEEAAALLRRLEYRLQEILLRYSAGHSSAARNR